MPKIIENLRSEILREVEDMLEKENIKSFSIRSLSQRLNIAPATIYNYFDSKEQIIGEILILHWQKYLNELDEKINASDNTVTLLIDASVGLNNFMQPLFPFWFAYDSEDRSTKMSQVNYIHIRQHKDIIIEQLKHRVERILRKSAMKEKDIKRSAPIITRLLIVCSHEQDLDLQIIIETCTRLSAYRNTDIK